MKIYVMPKEMKAGCLLYAWAMILEEEPKILIGEIGHDGMACIWPDLKEPYCYQGFHIQELIDCAIRRGKSVTNIDGLPASLPPPNAYLHLKAHNIGPHMVFEHAVAKQRFKQHVDERIGVLYGRVANGTTHAWAWDGLTAHDPRSGQGTSRLDVLKIMNAWLI